MRVARQVLLPVGADSSQIRLSNQRASATGRYLLLHMSDIPYDFWPNFDAFSLVDIQI